MPNAGSAQPIDLAARSVRYRALATSLESLIQSNAILSAQARAALSEPDLVGDVRQQRHRRCARCEHARHERVHRARNACSRRAVPMTLVSKVPSFTVPCHTLKAPQPGHLHQRPYKPRVAPRAD